MLNTSYIIYSTLNLQSKNYVLKNYFVSRWSCWYLNHDCYLKFSMIEGFCMWISKSKSVTKVSIVETAAEEILVLKQEVSVLINIVQNWNYDMYIINQGT